MKTFPNVKLNLGLDVLRRRPDGYHDIETLFVPCFSFSDSLEIEEAPEFSIDIVREGGIDWDPLQDLCAKAYRLLAADFPLPPVRISLEKRSPVGAGLGGGSSDAAFTLRMLSDMFSLGLSDSELASYAARLGSDCAFFVYNRPMFGSGRGEILSDFQIDLSDWRTEVIVPAGISVSTADAYRGIAPSLPSVPLREALLRPVGEWPGLVKNDFETTVFAKYPALADIKQSLYDRGAVYAAMSGSGSAVFALFRQ